MEAPASSTRQPATSTPNRSSAASSFAPARLTHRGPGPCTTIASAGLTSRVALAAGAPTDQHPAVGDVLLGPRAAGRQARAAPARRRVDVGCSSRSGRAGRQRRLVSGVSRPPSWPRAFFAAAFLAAAFLAGAFFAAAFFAAAVFLAGAFLAAAFLAGAFLAGAFLAGAAPSWPPRPRPWPASTARLDPTRGQAAPRSAPCPCGRAAIWARSSRSRSRAASRWPPGPVRAGPAPAPGPGGPGPGRPCSSARRSARAGSGAARARPDPSAPLRCRRRASGRGSRCRAWLATLLQPPAPSLPGCRSRGQLPERLVHQRRPGRRRRSSGAGSHRQVARVG